jgi:hypothetical protein
MTDFLKNGGAVAYGSVPAMPAPNAVAAPVAAPPASAAAAAKPAAAKSASKSAK